MVDFTCTQHYKIIDTVNIVLLITTQQKALIPLTVMGCFFFTFHVY